MPTCEGQKASAQPCSWCGKRFARAEHLLRHQRIHTQETPFCCPHCRRGFQRSDVRNRHIAKSCTVKSPVIIDNPNNGSDLKTPRAKVACDLCHAKKLKCTGALPCSHCTSVAKECRFSRAPARNPALKLLSEIGDGQISTASSSSQILGGEPPIMQSPRLNDPQHQQQLPEPLTFGMNNNPFQLSRSIQLAPGMCQLPLNNQYSDSNSRSSTTPVQTAASSRLEHQTALPNVFSESSNDILECNIDEYPWNMEFGEDSMTFMDNIFDLFPSMDQTFSPYQSIIEHPTDSMVDPAALITGSSVARPRTPAVDDTSQRLECPTTTRATFPQISSDASKWLKTRPSIKNHDRVIVNHFLNLFLRHLPPTLTSFSDFAINESTREEMILATAAVGGLYSVAHGNHIMSRAMCADARRLFLTRIHVDFPLETPQKIDVVQTFILLELFGIFCGDKRMCELSEAYHAHLLQIVAHCSFSELPGTTSERYKILSIAKDLQVLECYRTLILECPPNLYLTTPPFSRLYETNTPSLYNEPRWSLIDHVALFLDPSKPLTESIVAPEDAYTLSSLLVLCSHAVPTRSPHGGTNCLWDRRVFELALNRWLHSQKTVVADSTMILFHLGFIVLHVNMSSIHGAVREMSAAGAFSLPGTTITTQWRKSDACGVVTLHANRIVEIAGRIGTLQRSKHKMQLELVAAGDHNHTHDEAPHVAICLYLAVIVLWVARTDERCPNLQSSALILNKGISILRRLNMWLARGLGNILQLLEEKCLEQGGTT